MIFPLYGMGCHICGRPAEWYVHGVSLQCKCGAKNPYHLADAFKALSRHENHMRELRFRARVQKDNEMRAKRMAAAR